MRRLSGLGRLLGTIYFIEVGMLLLVAPWTRYWDRNVFVAASPLLEGALTNGFMRGAVSGTGIVTLLLGAADVGWLAVRVARRHRRLPETSDAEIEPPDPQARSA